MKPVTEIVKRFNEHGIMIMGGCDGEDGFAAQIERPDAEGYLRIVCSWGLGWDHVSVSREDRTPSWDDMAWVKDFFFRPDEAAMQLHPPQKDYVNMVKYCLHIWKPQDVEIPLPPTIMVGIPGVRLS